jgi:hypothetical protein
MDAMTDRWNPSALPEVPLLGGDVTEGIVRVGDTVRRPATDVSGAIRKLLAAVRTAGFEGAPEFLGVDDQQRDVLTFVAGEVADRPWPEWMRDNDRIASVARLVRRYDDAAATIGVPEWSSPMVRPSPTAAPESISPPPQFIAHLDITPENVVFRDGKAFALIDFDLARPASRVDEIVNLLLWWAPWMPSADRDPVVREVDAFQRTRVLLDAYGLDASDRALLVDVAKNMSHRSWHLMKHRAETIGGGWARMWNDGVGDVILRRQAWLRDNDALLRAATA